MAKRQISTTNVRAGYSQIEAVTKSDATVTNYDAVFIGGAGDIALKVNGGSAVTFTVPAGTILEFSRITRVMSTNTDATNIVGLTY